MEASSTFLWSVQLARRSCHFFPGRVEPVSLVGRAAEPRSIMKGAVMYLPVGAHDLWEGCGGGARRLYVPSLLSAETSIFPQRAVTIQCCRVIGHSLSTVSRRGYGAISQAWLPKGRLLISWLFLFPIYIVMFGTSNSLVNFPGWNCQLPQLLLCPVAFDVFP